MGGMIPLVSAFTPAGVISPSRPARIEDVLHQIGGRN